MNTTEIEIKALPALGVYSVLKTMDDGKSRLYGAPFLAKSDDKAKEMIVESVKDVKDSLPLELYSLVRLGDYRCIAENPLTSYDHEIEVCKAKELFDDQN